MSPALNTFKEYAAALSELRCPLAFVDLDLFDENAKALAARAGGLPIRVASKSIRSLALIQRVLKMRGFSGVLAYSGWEAVYLSKAHVRDIVVAYPIVDPSEINAVANELKAGSVITLMCDRVEHLEVLSKVAETNKVILPIALDLDLSTRMPGLHFGVRRSSIHDEGTLALFLTALLKFPMLNLRGVMGYEAQIAGVPDRDSVIRFLKKRSIRSISKRRIELVSQIKEAGHELRFVNGGGTGSVESTRLDSSVTELAAGSGLFAPTLFDGYDLFKHKPSAFYALRVTRKPVDTIATCFSGGYIASGSVGTEKAPRPVFPESLSLLPHEGAGEVQTPVTGQGARNLKIGDLVFFRHAKAGEYCERFNLIHLISRSKLLETVSTYRGEGLNFG